MTLFTLAGWAGQSAFLARSLSQWVSSERAGKSLVPPGFWALSILGSLLLAGYAWHQQDPVILGGQLVNLGLYARNARLEFLPERAPRSSVPLTAVLCGLLAVQLALLVNSLSEQLTPWLLVGWIGQGLFQIRFPLQWWVSERRGHSHLPAAFWWLSLVGSLLLLAYALQRRDAVIVAGQAFGWLTSTRNLVLLGRSRKTALDD